MVLSVRHQDVALRVDRDTLQALELPFTLAPPAETPEEGSVRVEDLDAIIAGICDEDVALLVHGNSSVSPKEKTCITQPSLNKK